MGTHGLPKETNKIVASRAHADIGKRDLPPQLRSRFTEVWVDEPGGRAELAAIAASYLGDAVPNPPVDDIVNFYLAAKAEAVRPCCRACCHGSGSGLPLHAKQLKTTRED